MGKKKSKQETGPSKFAQPYIQQGANAVQSAYQANQPNIANISQILQDNTASVVGSTLNNPGLAAAGAYNADVLGGKYLSGNPNLEGVIDNTNSDVTNRVQAAIGSRGGAGGSAQAQILARELAKNEGNLRYQDYATERGYQDKAVGNATALSGAYDNNIQALLQYLTGSATIPQSGADSYAQAIGSLLGNYTSTTKQNSGIDNFLNLAGTAAKIGSVASDRRLKTEITKIGSFPDGLGIYSYRYKAGGPMHMGVMADEVAEIRPHALGPTVEGYQTVQYGAL